MKYFGLIWLSVTAGMNIIVSDRNVKYLNTFNGSNAFHTLNDWKSVEWARMKLNPADKMVYFLRHGEGHHNAAEEKFGTELWNRKYAKSDEYFDPGLTEKGELFCIAESEIWKSQVGLVMDTVIVSPLTRTIQTAQVMFGNDTYTFQAEELCRETLGVHTCDKRKAKSVLIKTFPSVQFNKIKDENDTLWKKDHRETGDEVRRRAKRFLNVLFTEYPNSQHIAVVSHSGFIQACLQAIGYPVYPPQNCEFVPVILTSKNPKTSMKLLASLLCIGFVIIILQMAASSGHCPRLNSALQAIANYCPGIAAKYQTNRVRYTSLPPKDEM